MKKYLITSRTDWSPKLIEEIYGHIEDIGLNDMKLDIYPNQIEVVSAEQMLDAYASTGIPIMYPHWSFGKHFLKDYNQYKKGNIGLAYEMIINSNPAISYLMEENNAVTQALVLAHACMGHNFVFKNNYMFKDWTNAESMLDYFVFAKSFIRKCEEKYGEDEVEHLLDAAHALAANGIDKRKRKYKKPLSETDVEKLKAESDIAKQKNLDVIIKETTFRKRDGEEPQLNNEDNIYGEENLLYFLLKKSPILKEWQREVLRIVYKVHQYFYPQSQCVTGENLISTDSGLLRLDELIHDNGYNEVTDISLLTIGDKFTPISHTYKKLAKVIRITTANGRVYTGTPEHPLMALYNNKHALKTLGELNVNDYLVISSDYKNVFAKEYIKLNGSNLTPLTGKYIAYLQNFSSLHNNEITKFNDLTTKLFGEYHIHSVSNLTDYFNIDSISIPKCIRQSPKDVVIEYVKQLIDLVAVRRKSISNFKLHLPIEFLKQLQTVFAALGIMAQIKYPNSAIAFIRIVPTYRHKFEEIIGSECYTKHEKLHEYSDLDIIPGAKQLTENIKNFISDNKTKILKNQSKIYKSYSKLDENNALFHYVGDEILNTPNIKTPGISISQIENNKDFSNLFNIDNCEDSIKLKKLIDCSHNCLYDKVVSIEELDIPQVVYDVTVPENHLFWMGGIISHNTKTLNEGFATFTHFYIMNELEKKGLLSPDAEIAWLHLHSNVLYQTQYTDQGYNGHFNPYTLGFNILKDLKRICEDPTSEDREWFPDIIGKDWRDVTKDAVTNYRDESFIQQFLSPNLIRYWKMFTVEQQQEYAIVSDISDEQGYRNIRRALSLDYTMVNHVPDIIVNDAAMKDDRRLTLQYFPYNGRSLNKDYMEKTLNYVKQLWGYDVQMMQINEKEQEEIIARA